MSPLLKTLAILIGVLTPIVYLLEQNLASFFIFQTDHLHDLAKRGIAAHGDDTRSIVKYIVDELASLPATKAHVNLDEEWIFNNAGGAMGAMYIIHASKNVSSRTSSRSSSCANIYALRRRDRVPHHLRLVLPLALLTRTATCQRRSCFSCYAIPLPNKFSGTAVGTEGHTGRHTADDYFHILTGEQLAYTAGTYEPEVYPPGSVHHLRRGHIKQYKMPEACFALEYARGWIPPMMLFGFADGLFSTLDLLTLWRMTAVTAREMVGNLMLAKL